MSLNTPNISPLSETQFSLGKWIRNTRERKQISRAELARITKISYQGIYFIENGKTQNPNKETMGLIQAVLGEPLPIDIVSKQGTQRIDGLGQFNEINPYDELLLPEGGGIYVLYDISQRPIYIGKADNIRRRIKQHWEKFWFKRPIVETGCYIEILDDMLRTQIEQILIRLLKNNAVINKQYTNRADILD